MTDLVSRLRERHSFLCDEAADEVERLRGLLREARNELVTTDLILRIDAALASHTLHPAPVEAEGSVINADQPLDMAPCPGGSRVLCVNPDQPSLGAPAQAAISQIPSTRGDIAATGPRNGLTDQPSDALDAARYQWLRDRAWPFEFKGDTPEDADAAIDAAMHLAARPAAAKKHTPECSYWDGLMAQVCNCGLTERCCLDYPRCDCNSPPEPDNEWHCSQYPGCECFAGCREKALEAAP